MEILGQIPLEVVSDKFFVFHRIRLLVNPENTLAYYPMDCLSASYKLAIWYASSVRPGLV
jgi:hypothetical protein